MDEPKKRGFRFGLRTLLTAVAYCAAGMAIYTLLPNIISESELHMVRTGMTPEEVRAILGEPLKITTLDDLGEYTGDEYELWWYATSLIQYGSDWPEVSFKNGKVVGKP